MDIIKTNIENTFQNKKINKINICLGNGIETHIFNRNISEKYKQLYDLFIDYPKVYTNNKNYIQSNLHLKINKHGNFVTSSIFHSKEIVHDNDLSLLFIYSHETPQHQLKFPCELEYHSEFSTNEIEISISDTIKLVFIDDKYIEINIKKDAYIDNTLDQVIEVLTKIL
jgi:hypothetical protein